MFPATCWALEANELNVSDWEKFNFFPARVRVDKQRLHFLASKPSDYDAQCKISSARLQTKTAAVVDDFVTPSTG